MLQRSNTVYVLSALAAYLTVLFFIVEKCQSGRWDIFQIPRFPTEVGSYFNTEAFVIVICWMLTQVVLYLLPFGGKYIQGPPQRGSGTGLVYHANALFVLAVDIIAVLIAAFFGVSLVPISNKMLQLATTSVTTSLVLSVVVYIKAFLVPERQRNPKGNTGAILCDWFQGKELNPRIGNLDLKYVFFRSTIFGWIVINLINVLAAYDTTSGAPSFSLLLVFFMQLWYVADTFWFEDGIVHTREITHQGFGSNVLILGTTIPFTYCSQVRYMSLNNYSLPWYCLVAVAALFWAGYIIYRDSNLEKNNFRKNPYDPLLAYLETIPTKTGKRLLVSGWWGMSRHPNYFGDLLISLSFCLPAGFNHFFPYIIFFFVVLILVDREKTDGADCKERYGEAWDQYCDRVKYRIIPWIY